MNNQLTQSFHEFRFFSNTMLSKTSKYANLLGHKQYLIVEISAHSLKYRLTTNNIYEKLK